MKSKLLLPLLFLSTLLAAQRSPTLPAWLTQEEEAMMRWYSFTSDPTMRGIPEPPPNPVRTMAEWEELQALCVTWTGFKTTVRQIIQHAKEEVTVLVLVKNDAEKTECINALTSNNITLDNVEFVVTGYNTIWMRDYGPNFVYANEVGEPYIIDWIYNRPRPLDNAAPDGIGAHLGIPVYSTTEVPEDLVHTGGNFATDGLGTAFSSNLVLVENAPGNSFSVGPHNEADIDAIMQAYMGIDRYIKMETLPFDVIHHIDMHMKILDEETIMMGQYPDGIADGPQIEANLQYVVNNFNSAFGTPYKVVRIQMPPDNGLYPNNSNADYRTYTNSVFVNKTILVPVYEQQFDTTALKVYRDNFPGYKVVGIDCNSIIGSLGALHCITREIGVNDPLWIVHDRLDDIPDNELYGDYEVNANIKHVSGIANAQVYWTTDTLAGYAPLEMALTNADEATWTAYLPHQPNGTEIFYYIRGEANNTKTQVRPLPAPAGYFRFTVDGVSDALEKTGVAFEAIYPNPASSITVIPVNAEASENAVIEVADVFGRVVEVIFDGRLPHGHSKHFLHAEKYLPGTYFVNLKTHDGVQTQKMLVK